MADSSVIQITGGGTGRPTYNPTITMSQDNSAFSEKNSVALKGECMTAKITEQKGIIRFETTSGQHVATLVVRETTRHNGTTGDHAELWLPGSIQYGTLKDFTLLELLYRAVNRDDHPNTLDG